jgi:hypothetical protein
MPDTTGRTLSVMSYLPSNVLLRRNAYCIVPIDGLLISVGVFVLRNSKINPPVLIVAFP